METRLRYPLDVDPSCRSHFARPKGSHWRSELAVAARARGTRQTPNSLHARGSALISSLPGLPLPLPRSCSSQHCPRRRPTHPVRQPYSPPLTAWTSTTSTLQTTTATGSSYGTSGYRLAARNYLPFGSFTLSTQANGPLTNENVFDYFASSMFYDKQSSNQNLRMQTAWRDPGQPLLNEAEELR